MRKRLVMGLHNPPINKVYECLEQTHSHWLSKPELDGPDSCYLASLPLRWPWPMTSLSRFINN